MYVAREGNSLPMPGLGVLAVPMYIDHAKLMECATSDSMKVFTLNDCIRNKVSMYIQSMFTTSTLSAVYNEQDVEAAG